MVDVANWRGTIQRIHGLWEMATRRGKGERGDDAGKLLDCLYMEMSPDDAKRMLEKSERKFFS